MLNSDINNHIAINNIKATNVYNAHQSAFHYKMVTPRILSFKGKKSAFGLEQSVHTLTHSYTILLLISMPSKLGKFLFILLQEQGVKFGPQVSKTIEENEPGNILQ